MIRPILIILTIALAAEAVPSTARAADITEIVEQILAARRERAKDVPDIPADAYTRALGGEVVSGIEFVDGAKAGKGWGVAVYDVPVEAMWKAINDEGTYSGRLPLRVASRVLPS